MSTASKITFGVTLLASIGTVVFVHNMQANEREALHQGPIRDQERIRLKREAAASAVQAAVGQPVEMTRAQKLRAAEYELQKSLREQYSKVQSVSDVPEKEDLKNN